MGFDNAEAKARELAPLDVSKDRRAMDPEARCAAAKWHCQSRPSSSFAPKST